MPSLHIRRLESGGVITNYHCISRCGHCLYNSSPHRSRDYLDESMAEAIFSHIISSGCRSVHIGGGEPLLEPQGLMAVIRAARSSGIGIDYVETNSGWYSDAGNALDMLAGLKAEGVSALLISMSPFHNAHIPFARVKRVIEACRRVGIQALPWGNVFARELTRLEDDCVHTMEEFEAAYGPNYLQCIPGRYWVHLGGRAIETFRSVFPNHSVEDILKNSPLSCARALSDTSHFHIDLYGNYIPGLCTGLAIAMDDVGGPLRPGAYPLIDQLAATGIGGLYEFARQEYDYSPGREAYLNHCDLCTDIRSYLSSLQEFSFKELAPEEFYPAS